jgi:hypothetical protein
VGHKRADIRNACVAKLTGATAAGDRVVSNRAARFFGMAFPYISIFALNEESGQNDMTGTDELRTLNLAIDLYVSVTEGIEDEIDDLAKAVEDLMDADDALGGHAINCELKGTETDLSMAGDQPFGLARLTYQVTYLA